MADWEWLGHAQHFVAARDCQFRMGTKIGPYVVSTVGEYVQPEAVAKVLGRKVGEFEEIGYGRKYETFVFKATEARKECGCPELESYSEIDSDGYNDAVAATAGHLEMCRKYSDLHALDSPADSERVRVGGRP